MDIMKIFKMQEPVNPQMLTTQSKKDLKMAEENKLSEINDQLQEIIREKDVIINNNVERITELEHYINSLHCKKSKRHLGDNTEQLTLEERSKFIYLLNDYENLYKAIYYERIDLIKSKELLKKNLALVEAGYQDLVNKFESAKSIIEGFKKNEELLKSQLLQQEEMLKELNGKYDKYKAYAHKAIKNANKEIVNKDKQNIAEIAKLKSKILQSQAKINSLEKHVKYEVIDATTSMFAPLNNDCLKRK